MQEFVLPSGDVVARAAPATRRPVDHSNEKVLFDGKDIRLIVNDSGSDVSLLTFSPRPQYPGNNMVGFGRDFIVNEGYTGAYVIAKWAHWWQSEEVDKAIRILTGTKCFAAARHRLAYGGSMGGFGALKFAAAFGCNSALIVSPQISVQPELASFETRWADDIAKIAFRNPDARTDISADCRYQIIYDPFDSLDRQHIAMLPAHPSLEICPIPFCGHSPLQMFREVDLLKPLVIAAAEGALDLEVMRQRVRERRRYSPSYLANLAQAAARQRHMGVAVWAARRRFDADQANSSAFYHYAALLRNTRQSRVLLNEARRHLDLSKRSRHGWANLKYALFQEQRFEDAMQAAAKACALPDSNVDDWKWYVELLSKLGRSAEAVAVGRLAAEKFPGDLKIQYALYMAFIAESMLPEARSMCKAICDRTDVNPDYKSRVRAALSALVADNGAS